MTVHTEETLARDYNCEVVVPLRWQPPRFDRPDWMWIKTIAQAGVDQDGLIQNIKVGSGPSAMRLTCMHRTQPKRNFTVFYRRLAQETIMVVGIGHHKGNNSKYSVDWADGRSNRIDLAKKQTSGDPYLINPIGGLFAFTTLDATINTSCLVEQPTNPK